jgi:hypothetical protein
MGSEKCESDDVSEQCFILVQYLERFIAVYKSYDTDMTMYDACAYNVRYPLCKHLTPLCKTSDACNTCDTFI